jgi:hypothetical protein
MFLDRLKARRSHGKPSILHVPSGVRSAVELLGAECWLKFDSKNSIVENRMGPPGLRTWIRRGIVRLVKRVRPNL